VAFDFPGRTDNHFYLWQFLFFRHFLPAIYALLVGLLFFSSPPIHCFREPDFVNEKPSQCRCARLINCLSFRLFHFVTLSFSLHFLSRLKPRHCFFSIGGPIALHAGQDNRRNHTLLAFARPCWPPFPLQLILRNLSQRKTIRSLFLFLC